MLTLIVRSSVGVTMTWKRRDLITWWVKNVVEKMKVI